MRTFKHFPKDEICLLCGTNEDKECILIPIDRTSDGSICEAIPVHAECARKGDLRYNSGANIFYKVGVPCKERVAEIAELNRKNQKNKARIHKINSELGKKSSVNKKRRVS